MYGLKYAKKRNIKINLVLKGLKTVRCVIRKGNRLAALLSLFVGMLTVSVSFKGKPVF